MLIVLEQYRPGGLKELLKSEKDLGKLDKMFQKALQLKFVEEFPQYLEKDCLNVTVPR